MSAGVEEELAVVFVAICRAVGLLARTVRALEPAPLKPTPASLVRNPTTILPDSSQTPLTGRMPVLCIATLSGHSPERQDPALATSVRVLYITILYIFRVHRECRVPNSEWRPRSFTSTGPASDILRSPRDPPPAGGLGGDKIWPRRDTAQSARLRVGRGPSRAPCPIADPTARGAPPGGGPHWPGGGPHWPEGGPHWRLRRGGGGGGGWEIRRPRGVGRKIRRRGALRGKIRRGGGCIFWGCGGGGGEAQIKWSLQ
eukprot:199860-Prorocentrum_minimum.AAC.10